MPATVVVNFRTVVHASSGGITPFFPDVCKTPAPPAPFVPIPYPNIAKSADTAKGSSTVKMDGNPIMIEGSNFSTSMGDEAGSMGGIVSSCTKGKAEFVMYSFDVKADGKGVCRQLDMMLGNKGGTFNTPPMAEMQAPAVVVPFMDTDGPEPSMSSFKNADSGQESPE